MGCIVEVSSVHIWGVVHKKISQRITCDLIVLVRVLQGKEPRGCRYMYKRRFRMRNWFMQLRRLRSIMISPLETGKLVVYFSLSLKV